MQKQKELNNNSLFSNYPGRLMRGYKNKLREVNEASNVIVQDSSNPRIFLG